ncbi:MAG: sucrose-6-phosphate hydrolase [Lachnospiraceae bacterium]|nr:sucrose-6-phosphate hydrolase [Lachnospiraceae bacterium]
MKHKKESEQKRGMLSMADNYIAENLSTVHPTYRHTFHAMPPIGWMNDPNGFNYAFGKYHLFYQFYPYGAAWDSMHWGHYTTQDFIHWRIEPTALAPDGESDKDGCFSGTSILKDGKLYLMYTSVLADIQTQSLAVSFDGIKFEKLGEVIPTSKRPHGALRTEFRDPKVFLRDGMYYALIGSRTVDGEGQILLYRSSDLTDWEYVNAVRKDNLTTRGIYECPDLFEIAGKDVMLTSPQGYETKDWRFENWQSSIYMVGKLNMQTGVFEKEYEDEIDGGFDFYAPQTLTAPDGRVIMIAWMQMWGRRMPTAQHGWAGSMILPREITLKDGKLYQTPVRELQDYRWNEVKFCNVPLKEKTVLAGVFGKKVDLSVIFRLGDAKAVGVKLFASGSKYAKIYYDAQHDLVVFDRSEMGVEIFHDAKEKDAAVRSVKVSTKGGILTMRIILDIVSCEVFLNDGERVMTGNVYSGGSEISFFAEGGNAEIIELVKYDVIK